MAKVTVKTVGEARTNWAVAGAKAYGAKKDYAGALDGFLPKQWPNIAFNRSPESNGVSKQELDQVKAERDTARAEWVTANPEQPEARFDQEWQQMKAHSKFRAQPEKKTAKSTPREKYLNALRAAYRAASEPEATNVAEALKLLENLLIAEGVNVEEE